MSDCINKTNNNVKTFSCDYCNDNSLTYTSLECSNSLFHQSICGWFPTNSSLASAITTTYINRTISSNSVPVHLQYRYMKIMNWRKPQSFPNCHKLHHLLWFFMWRTFVSKSTN